MAEYLIQDTTLDAIADAINAKTGGSSAMTPVEMVLEIQSIPTGGGGSHPLSDFAWHTVQFTLAASTATETVRDTYAGNYMIFLIYPADADNTDINTIAIGSKIPLNLFNDGNTPITTPTGVSLSPATIPTGYVNDQTYNAVRARGNYNAKPAGNYIMTWYGTEA